jgi:hypothetical protein
LPSWRKNLAVDGIFEINQYLGPEMVDLLKMNFKNIEITKISTAMIE